MDDLATHDIDAVSWLLGDGYESVSAQSVSVSGRGVEDLVLVTGTTKSGVAVNHVVNWLSPRKERTITLSTERGMFVADTVAADLTFFANGLAQVEWEAMATFRGVNEGDVTRYSTRKVEPLVTEHLEFQRYVLGRKSSSASLEEAAETVRVCEAVKASAQRRGALISLGV